MFVRDFSYGFAPAKTSYVHLAKISLTVAIGNLPGGTTGYPAHPRLIHLSVCLSVISLLIILQKIAQAKQIWRNIL